MSSTHAYVAAAFATAALAAVHALVPVVRRRLGSVREGVVAAIGGGVASAYVFLHLLSEIARGNEEVAELLGETANPIVLAEVLLFLVAFAGFVLLYGLDHAAARADRESGVCAVHIGVFAVYNALITYALPTRFEVGPASAVLFTVAMAVHFVLSDRGLAEHHGERFRRVGRPLVVASLVVGTCWPSCSHRPGPRWSA